MVAKHKDSQGALGRRNHSRLQLQENRNKAEWKRLGAEISDKNQLIGELQCEKSGLTAQLEVAKEAAVELKAEHARITEQLSSQVGTAEQSQKRVKELQALLKEQEETITSLRDQLAASEEGIKSSCMSPMPG